MNMSPKWNQELDMGFLFLRFQRFQKFPTFPNGKVYAVDIQESVVKRLRKIIERERITNIHPKIDDVYSLSFEDDSVDRVLAIATLPEILDPIKALREFHRVLKQDGLLCLSELLLDADYPLRRTEKRWASKTGFKLKKEYGNLFVYQLIFEKKQDSLEMSA